MRTSITLIVAAGVLLAATGCSASGTAGASCDGGVPSGDATSVISAAGSFGVKPTVTFPTPVISDRLETSVIDDGEGMVLQKGDIVDLQATLYSGKTGEQVSATEYDPAKPLRLTIGDPKSAIAQALQCIRVGSRVASTMTVEQLVGTDGQLDPALGLTAKDTLVLVSDVENGYLGKANGVPQLPVAGVPSVVTAPNGTPGITMLDEPAPKDLRIALLQKGDGPKVKKGDEVVVHYSGVLWGADTTFDSSWTRGVPSTFVAESLTDSDAGLVPGFAKALIGQTVGSQVIVVIPPKDGYPKGKSPQAIPEGSTMVFVFDVLGIQ